MNPFALTRTNPYLEQKLAKSAQTLVFNRFLSWTPMLSTGPVDGSQTLKTGSFLPIPQNVRQQLLNFPAKAAEASNDPRDGPLAA
jgi:hypothetical protein